MADSADHSAHRRCSRPEAPASCPVQRGPPLAGDSRTHPCLYSRMSMSPIAFIGCARVHECGGMRNTHDRHGRELHSRLPGKHGAQVRLWVRRAFHWRLASVGAKCMRVHECRGTHRVPPLKGGIHPVRRSVTHTKCSLPIAVKAALKASRRSGQVQERPPHQKLWFTNYKS
jgi:hypothetical protein